MGVALTQWDLFPAKYALDLAAKELLGSLGKNLTTSLSCSVLHL